MASIPELRGIICLAAGYTRDIIAATSEWQNWTGLSEEDSKDRIHFFMTQRTDRDGVLLVDRPVCIIRCEGDLDPQREAGGIGNVFSHVGAYNVLVEDAVPKEYRGTDNLEAANVWWLNHMGSLYDDLEALSDRSGYQNVEVTAMSVLGLPAKEEPEVDYRWGAFNIQWSDY